MLAFKCHNVDLFEVIVSRLIGLGGVADQYGLHCGWFVIGEELTYIRILRFKSEGFEKIVDFLNANPIKYALTINPTIYVSCIKQFWATIKAKTVNREVQLQALVDRKKIVITESIVRRNLQLEDAEAPLFPTMVVQAQEEMGEGSEMPTDPHHTPIITQPSSSQPQKKQKSRRPKRKDTQVPQPSDPIHVADEAVNKEMDDSLVRAATTAIGLDADRDSGSGPRRQDTMGDTIAQTGFKNVSMKLQKLMELCTNLQKKVLDLETLKTAQAQEITSLKLIGKRFEKKGGSRTHKLKRLHKVGRLARVVSSDEASLGDQEDASKQSRKIHDIDANEDITLENVHDAEMFDVNDLHGDEVFVEKEVPVKEVSTANPVTTAGEVVTTIDVAVSIASTIPVSAAIITKVDITLAQALAELKIIKPKVTTATTTTTKGILLQEPSESRTTTTTTIPLKDKGKGIMIETDYELAQRLQVKEQEELTVDEKATLFQQLLEKRKNHFAAKRVEEKRNRPPIKAQQRSIITELVEVTEKEKGIQKAKAKVIEGSTKRAGDELEQEKAKNQKVDDDQETVELQKQMEVFSDKEEVAIDAIPLATKPPSIVDYKIIKEGKINNYQIIRAVGSSKSILLVIMKLLMKKLDDFEDKYQVYGRIVGIKRLHDVLEVTAAKLVLMVQKLLLLVLKVNAAKR
ncbi:hypothetical protein Tco_1058264 [Tanacetum coccineum]|uniref:Uncharacterized protein n=1 Tax=Tanacetum coccineum TaxID=301880 RepID=A0ABQ5H9J7_9ASTR